MSTSRQPLLTIEELSARAALALSVDYDGSASGRVRDVPDLRTIRYYTTLGLLDRPAEMRGRTALYGRRHLLQVVGIKRLQARGLSLAEIQQQMLGVTDSALARLARLPDLDNLPSTPTSTEATSRRSERFWTASPAPVPESKPPIEGSVPVQGIPLDDQVMLLLTPSRPIEEEDISALRIAAAPLLKLLEARRLIQSRKERGNS